MQNISNQNLQVREFGPIDVEFELETPPKISDQFQVIKKDDLTFFAETYPRFQTGDILKIVGEANSEGLVFKPEIKKVGSKRSILTNLADLRRVISRRVDALLPSREATLVKGMVLGVDEMDKSFREQLINTGTIHAVVVSGQNLSIVAGFFLVFVRYSGRRLAMILSIFSVIFYALLTGFEVPVIRALIMVILGYAAVFLGREKLSVWSLFLSALIIMLVWPQAIFEVSFQLTFAATLGIMTLGRRLQNLNITKSEIRISNYETNSNVQNYKYKTISNSDHSNFGIVEHFLFRKANFVLGASNFLKVNAAVATSAYLFTAPIIFFHFGKVSLIAPFVNLLIAEAIVPIMVLGFGVAISSLIFIPFAQILAYLAYVPSFYFVKVVEIFGK